jgi:hypothetical protein
MQFEATPEQTVRETLSQKKKKTITKNDWWNGSRYMP